MKKRKLKIKNLIIFILMIICLIGIIYSSYMIITWKLNVDENKDIKEKIDDNIKIIEPKNDEIEDENENKEIIYDIDFKTLKETNKDTVAYVKVNNTNIDYIVVKGKDNDYYLNHNFEKKWNIAGWIFADFHNKLDETDKNLIIYGHNTKDGSMFGTLKNILNEEWYKNIDNYKVILVTENGQYTYQVFSTYSIKPEDYYINTEFNSDIEFEEFIKKLKSRSIYDYGIEVTKDDKILTLSSCMNEGAKRVVLHAKLIERKN